MLEAIRTAIDGVDHWILDGATFPVISGGADDDPPPDPKDNPPPDPKKDDDDPPDLGEAGKRALAAERAARRDAEKKAKDAEKELEELRKASQTDQEKALEAARTEGRTEALSTANVRLLKAEIKVAAQGKLADPTDAVALLDLSKFEVNDDGDVDTKAISSAIDELVEQKPHLAAKATRPRGDGGGGPRGDAPEGKSSMNELIRQKAGRAT